MPSKYLLALINPNKSITDQVKLMKFWEEADNVSTKYALKLAGQLELLK